MLESENLQVLIQLDHLLKEVGSGKLNIELLTHKGKAKGVSVFGSKKLLYNRSQADTLDNERACEDILKRVFEAIKRGEREELEFSVKVSGSKVNHVEWHSRQEKVFDNRVYNQG